LFSGFQLANKAASFNRLTIVGGPRRSPIDGGVLPGAAWTISPACGVPKLITIVVTCGFGGGL
jgi:hypothetical protein